MNKLWTLCKKSLYFFSSYLTQEDFSRFGRNSIETGYFIERVFPLFHTRFISINDDFDSDQHKGDTGGMDVAFKYLISEYYSRDMSIKTKSAKYDHLQHLHSPLWGWIRRHVEGRKLNFSYFLSKETPETMSGVSFWDCSILKIALILIFYF